MTAGKGSKKEKIFHPKSRKAGQLERTKLRKEKIVEARDRRTKRVSSNIDKYTFFYHAIPPASNDYDTPVLTLDGLHCIVRDVWLCRHDYAIEEEEKSRRKGRPKSSKQTNLENLKSHEAEEYRTGLEVPDLTHQENVGLFLRWDQQSIEYIDLLRFIRINAHDKASGVVTRPGKHETLKQVTEKNMQVDS